MQSLFRHLIVFLNSELGSLFNSYITTVHVWMHLNELQKFRSVPRDCNWTRDTKENIIILADIRYRSNTY